MGGSLKIGLKVHLHEIFYLQFFHNKQPSFPLINKVGFGRSRSLHGNMEYILFTASQAKKSHVIFG